MILCVVKASEARSRDAPIIRPLQGQECGIRRTNTVWCNAVAHSKLCRPLLRFFHTVASQERGSARFLRLSAHSWGRLYNRTVTPFLKALAPWQRPDPKSDGKRNETVHIPFFRSITIQVICILRLLVLCRRTVDERALIFCRCTMVLDASKNIFKILSGTPAVKQSNSGDYLLTHLSCDASNCRA